MTSPVPVGHSLASAGRGGASTLPVTGLAVIRASEKSAPDAPMYVKGRAVMVRGRFLRLQGSLCDRCATALRATLDLGASATPGRPKQGQAAVPALSGGAALSG